MGSIKGISKQEILEYLRLEEADATADLLKAASLIHVGEALHDGVLRHYWSYPTAFGVGWVSFSPSENSLGMEAPGTVPLSIKAATVAREQHPTKKPRGTPPPPPDRSPVPNPIWVPDTQAPALHYFPMYEDAVSIQEAAAAFSAKTKRADVGIQLWVQYFCVKLTSGRYAVIEAREAYPGHLSIELEVEDSDEDYPLGYVHRSDLHEVLRVLGRECRPTLKDCQYHWRD